MRLISAIDAGRGAILIALALALVVVAVSPSEAAQKRKRGPINAKVAVDRARASAVTITAVYGPRTINVDGETISENTLIEIVHTPCRRCHSPGRRRGSRAAESPRGAGDAGPASGASGCRSPVRTSTGASGRPTHLAPHPGVDRRMGSLREMRAHHRPPSRWSRRFRPTPDGCLRVAPRPGRACGRCHKVESSCLRQKQD